MCGFADVERKGNMKKLNSAKASFILFGIMTFACVSGSISSTLAWYAYSTRALVSYSGTSVSETAMLQIGICSDVVIDMPSSVSHVTFGGDSNHYYFSTSGRGMTYDIIANYLSAKSFATNELEPTTSGKFNTGSDQDSFSLKQAPSSLSPGNDIAAKKSTYLTIPLVFRVQGEDPSGTIYLDGKELWLSKAVARASSSGDGEVYKAIRIFVDRDSRNYASDYIVNPSASAKGQTRVGGLLNIARDDFYDYEGPSEILFGEYKDEALGLLSANGYAGANIVHDVNGVGDDDPSTFVAKHHQGTRYYPNLSDYEAYFEHASYESISSIAPYRDEHDNIANVDPYNPTSVCKTRADDNHLARVNLTVYLEGWDFSVIDKEIAHSFDLGLTFEMARI